ncbi:MAG TPA: SDR family NAD(P)-dependent oxidoreductase [Ilumatobacteraceae bacterium]|nr:SDR family NAD(P)-dependent oxidoreductase [Ilumatobacteraceae bacterium]
MEELRGKVAVVTGAASGIGLGMAQRFAAEGMRVVMADVERNALQASVDELAATGADVIAAPTDTSVFDEVDALASRTLDRFGAVHVLCNNAGVGSRGLPFRELPLRDFEWVLGVNLWGVIHGLHAFLPHLRLQDEGHIVNTASVSALYHLPSMAPYNASKAAVLALSETLKFELDAEGSHVGVSVLCPSWVRTNISTASRNLPERLAYELTTEQMAQIAEYKGRRKQQQTTAMEPDEVAEQVCDAIRTNRFYVITHPASIANMQDRFDRIVAGENPIEPDQ